MAKHPSPEQLRAHLTAANPAVLAASLTSTTGDVARGLGYVAAITHSVGPAGMVPELPDPERHALTEWAVEVLTDPDPPHGHTGKDLDDETFARFATSLVGWEVSPASAEFFREQAGFSSFTQTVARTQQPPKDFMLVIIGAGMSGISMAISAEQAGIPYTVLERHGDLGGIWQTNTYPGAGVDTPSRYYSFSFNPNPHWSHPYPDGPQYLEYLKATAAKYDVVSKISFNAEVSELVWDDAENRWRVHYEQHGVPKTLEANAILSAAGYLTGPQLPAVAGLDEFTGASFHSAEWDHDVDLRGKRVAVVGTGCTGVQLVDAIADEVAELTVVIRQPHWIMPPGATGAAFGESEKWLEEHVPEYVIWSRLDTFLPISDALFGAVHVDEEWAAEHDTSISSVNDMYYQLASAHLRESFADRPDLLARLTPDFAPFGKRIVRDPGGYFAALTRDTSTLVSSGLGRVTPTGFVDGDGVEHEVDAIIYATGFRLEYLRNLKIAGVGGALLADVWGDSPLAYNGCLVPDFPNLFITSGPHANPSHGGGHTFHAELITRFATETLQRMFEEHGSRVEATHEALERWRGEIHQRLAQTVWTRETRATTYYRNARDEVILPSPMPMEEYWARMREPDLVDIRIT